MTESYPHTQRAENLYLAVQQQSRKHRAERERERERERAMASSSRSTSFDRRGFESLIQLIRVLFFVHLFVLIRYSMLYGLLLLVLNTIAYLTLLGMTRRPVNNPSTFVIWSRAQNRRRPVVLCLGDSLTHGTCSADFTTVLAPQLCASLALPLPDASAVFVDPVWVVNAGQNSITTHTIWHERLNTALNVYPDYILLLIGTNDVQCIALGPNSLIARKIVAQNALPEMPTLSTLERNLTGILHYIHEASPKVEIGLCTLPPLGEDLSSSYNQCVRNANAIIERVAHSAATSDNKVSVVPLYAALEAVLEKERNKWTWPYTYFMVAALMEYPIRFVTHFVAGLTIPWNTLCQPFGYTVLSDGLHLNERGRDILVQVVVEWLHRKNLAKAIAVKS
jgi:acyl-CoA thioesterase I